MTRPRDTTVAGLIRKLQDVVAACPEAATYHVMMEDEIRPYAIPWRGTTYRRDDERTLDLEAPH